VPTLSMATESCHRKFVDDKLSGLICAGEGSVGWSSARQRSVRVPPNPSSSEGLLMIS